MLGTLKLYYISMCTLNYNLLKLYVRHAIVQHAHKNINILAEI